MVWSATTVGDRTKVCRSRSLTTQHRKVRSVAHDGSDPSDDLFIGMVQCTTTITPDWKVPILVNHQRTSFKIDTGAQCNVISKSQYHQLSSLPLQQSQARLVAFDGECLNACGRVTMKCEHKGNVYAVNFEVIDQEVPKILGLQTCVEMNLVQCLDAINNNNADFLDSYSDVFEGLGCISNTEYHIKVDKTYQPVVHPPRRVPVTL